MSRRPVIICFGEILIDELPDGRRLLGGAPLNLAARLQWLGMQAIVISRLGHDTDGDMARQTMRQIGLSDELVQCDDFIATGRVTVIGKTADGNGATGGVAGEAGSVAGVAGVTGGAGGAGVVGEDYIIHVRAAYDNIMVNSEMLEAIRRADAVCYGTLIRRRTNGNAAKALDTLLEHAPANAIRLLDLNLRKQCHTPQTVLHSLASCNVLRMSIEEARWLSRQFDIGINPDNEAQQFTKAVIERWSLRYCCISRGGNGLLAANSDGQFVSLPAIETEVVDTVGAGDGCSAGFVAGLLLGKSLAESAKLAIKTAAASCTVAGGTARPECEVPI